MHQSEFPLIQAAASNVEQPAAALQIQSLAPNLLEWFDRCGRKHLPWQQQPTPYRVWISEIMLQQTQVATVIPYYERFISRFADVQALARAPLDEVLHLWTGLGYYARPRNLHRAAQRILAQHDGRLPETLAELQALPGIGRSTAGAVLALACAQRQPILDGNVKRVLARYFKIAGFPGEPAIERRLWVLADACTPQQRVGHYTQAIMDLGATLCTRSRPACERCPLNAGCGARIAGMQAVLPTRRLKKVRPQRSAHVVISWRPDGAVLLERRPPAGIWGGLWTFPQFDDSEAAQRWIEQQHTVFTAQAQRPYQHSFTHFDLTLHPLVVRVTQSSALLADGDRHVWYDPRQPARIGLAKPAVDLIDALGAGLLGPTS